MTPEKKAEILKLRTLGTSYKDIARRFDITPEEARTICESAADEEPKELPKEDA